jgi:hypothetical protein
MAEVAGVGVARDEAGEAGIAPYHSLTYSYHNLEMTIRQYNHPNTCSI